METVLLNLEKSYRPAQSKTHESFAFQVPEGLNKLVLRLSYWPAKAEITEEAGEELRAALTAFGLDENPLEWRDYLPLGNHITLSADDPKGYRGNAHRKCDDQCHELGEGFASPGFYKGAIIAGAWRVCLHFHAIVSPLCHIKLSVTGESL